MFDVVKLIKDVESENLSAGMTGTVLMIYDEPNLPLSYEVEFLDDEKEHICYSTIAAENVELYWRYSDKSFTNE